MDRRESRIDLIRKRHKKLILEPKRQMEYALIDDWDDEPRHGEEDLVGVGVDLPDSDGDDE